MVENALKTPCARARHSLRDQAMLPKTPSTRVRRRYLVEWQAGDDAVCTGFTHDISPTGGFVRSSNIPQVGATIALCSSSRTAGS
ncbi:MAG TPA: hypothetical protein VNC59_05440 [Thermoanaerobaculia bacterium]|nr:hypothetical protein [Thermoanaerobaculia bacterium]